MADFFLIRHKQTGVVSKVRVLPYMGQNTQFEQLDPDEYFKKPKMPPVNNDDLVNGVTSGEDGR